MAMSNESDHPDEVGPAGPGAAGRRRPGTDVGTATPTGGLSGRAASRGGRPGAATVLDVDTAKVVVFEFDTGDALAEHAAHHPILVQVIRGRVGFDLPDRSIELAPGEVLHLTPLLRHGVRALEPTTLTVTMLRGSAERG